MFCLKVVDVLVLVSRVGMKIIYKDFGVNVYIYKIFCFLSF